MKIKINKLQLFGYHGVYDEEKKNGQDFEISLSVKLKKIKSYNDQIENIVYNVGIALLYLYNSLVLV